MATIKRTGGNTFEVTAEGGLMTVLVSYETPVAVKNAEGKVARTATRFSRSTEKHIRDFERSGSGTLGTWLQENLDQLLVELTGSTRLRGKAAAARLGRAVETFGIDYDEHTEPGDANLVVPVYRR